MAKNGFSLDEINARLGKQQQSKRYDDYDDVDYRQVNAASDEDEDDDSSATMSAGFLATLVAGFVAVAGGTYMFSAGVIPMPTFSNSWGSEYVSSVDPICRKLWRPGARNDAALQCYLTTNVKRLCDKQERKHLAKIIGKYRMDIDSQQARVVVGAIQLASQAQRLSGEMMTDVMSNGGTLNPRTEAQRQRNEEAMMEAGMRMSQKFEALTKDSPLMNGSMFSNERIPDATLAQQIRSLGERGFMSKWDFGWLADPLVTDAFATARKPKNDPCSDG